MMMHVCMNVKGVNMGEILPEHDEQKHSRKAPSVRGADTQILSYGKYSRASRRVSEMATGGN